MQIYVLFLSKLTFLYVLIFLGFLAARALSVQKEHVAKLLLYIIAPAVVFYGAYTAPLNAAALSLPFAAFGFCAAVSFAFLFVGRKIFGASPLKNVLAFAAGTGNAGYFGLPVALALFGNEALSLAVLVMLGVIFFENSLGFFIAAKGTHSGAHSLKKLLKLPTVYTFLLGLTLNALDVRLPLEAAIANFRGAYTLLGMMMIGMSLAGVRRADFDVKFLGVVFFAKFAVWPALVVLFIALDKAFFGFYDAAIYNILILISIVPIAANSVAFATELNVYPQRVALAVLLSTLFAFFYIPLMFGVLSALVS